MIDIDPNDLIQVLQQKLGAFINDAIMREAMCNGLKRQIAEKDKRIAELEANQKE